MNEFESRSTRPNPTILNIPLPGARRIPYTEEIPQVVVVDQRVTPARPDAPEAEPTDVLNPPAPRFDWSKRDEVNYGLQVKLADLQAWQHLRDTYLSVNLLISSINSDLVMLGDPRPFAYLEEF